MPVRTEAAVRAPAVPAMQPALYRVVTRVRETPGVVTLALEPLNGTAPGFAPGQFNMLYAFGVGEVPISIAGVSRSGATLHTVRDVGGVTHALCAAGPGTVLGVRGPFGTGWEIERATGGDVIVVAGGIGLAPLRSAVRGIIAERDRYGRVAVLGGARSPDLLLYAREIASWRARFDLHVDVTVDQAGSDWKGHVGLVTDLLERAPFDPAVAHAFLCGPEVMMRVVSRDLADRGVSPDRIRLSLERNMKCGIGQCGHCQLGPVFLCTDGPVFTYGRMAPYLGIKER